MKILILSLALIVDLSLPLMPQPSAAAADTLALADRVRIRSAVLNEDRELLVAKPAGYEKAQAVYPVLYVLDAETNFSFTVGIVRYFSAYRMIPDMIVVGVANTDRTRDMTPNGAEAQARYSSAGGADRFLRFLGEEAVARIDKDYRTSPLRGIVGHSLSGLLAVHALLTRSDLFSAYIAISPSLWWNQYETLDKIQAFYKSRPSLKKDVFVSLANESEDKPEVYSRIEDAFKKSLPKGLAVRFQIYKQENHISTAVVSTMNALLQLFPGSFATPPK